MLTNSEFFMQDNVLNKRKVKNKKILSKKEIASEESIERIILASIDCVAKFGYNGASTLKIAKIANVSKSLIHYYFKTKEELLLKALNYFANEIAEEIKLKINNYEPSLETAIIAAKELYRSLIANKTRAAFFVEMYSNAIHNKKFRKKLQSYHAFEEDLIFDVIFKALYPLENHLIITLRELSKVFQTIMLGLAVQSVIELNEEDLQYRLDTLLKILTTVLINNYKK
jgi:AcrR family transcriptional regulator